MNSSTILVGALEQIATKNSTAEARINGGAYLLFFCAEGSGFCF